MTRTRIVRPHIGPPPSRPSRSLRSPVLRPAREPDGRPAGHHPFRLAPEPAASADVLDTWCRRLTASTVRWVRRPQAQDVDDGTVPPSRGCVPGSSTWRCCAPTCWPRPAPPHWRCSRPPCSSRARPGRRPSPPGPGGRRPDGPGSGRSTSSASPSCQGAAAPCFGCRTAARAGRATREAINARPGDGSVALVALGPPSTPAEASCRRARIKASRLTPASRPRSRGLRPSTSPPPLTSNVVLYTVRRRRGAGSGPGRGSRPSSRQPCAPVAPGLGRHPAGQGRRRDEGLDRWCSDPDSGGVTASAREVAALRARLAPPWRPTATPDA